MAEPSVVNFAADFLEYVMVLAETTDIRAGEAFGGYYVTIGKHKFEGEDKEQVFRKILYFLLVTPMTMTPEEYAEHAGHVLEMEAEQTEELLHELTKGGMSAFGQKVEEFRKGRGIKVQIALEEVNKESGLEWHMDELLLEVRGRTGLLDLDSGELLIGLAERVKLTQEGA